MFMKMFSGTRGLLIDVTGVLYESGTNVPIAGSIQAVAKLRQSGLIFRFVSNESQCSTQGFLEKLKGLGYTDLKEKEVFLPAPAAAKYIKQSGLSPFLLVHPGVEPEFRALRNTDGSPDSVLIGDAAEHFSYENLNEAFNVLNQTPYPREPKLLTLGYGRYYKHGDKLNLDVGPFVEAIRFAIGPDRLKPLVFGKPSANYFNAALADIALDADEVVMIGDDVISDVGGAMLCGMQGILVKTGKYTNGDEINKEIPPDAVVDNLLAAVNLILKDKK